MSHVHGGARFLFTMGLLGSVACGGKDPGPVTHGAGGGAPAAAPAAEAPPEPYTYPAPVSGHYQEVNTGDFDLVDGLAWGPTRAGETAVSTSQPP